MATIELRKRLGKLKIGKKNPAFALKVDKQESFSIADTTKAETPLSEAKLDSSYKVSETGKLLSSNKGYVISSEGVHQSPMQTTPRNSKTPPPQSPACRGPLNPENLLFIRKLGRGASGIVELALDKKSYDLLAVKSINIYDRSKRHQFFNELAGFEAIVSPKIIAFHGAYFKEHAFLVMEYMHLGSFQDIVVKYGPIPEKLLPHVAREMLLGLQALHQIHQVHRDIKPANILVSVKGDIKTSDFGISRNLEKTDACSNTFVGTAMYMSPERITNQKYSYPADIWSLGLTLFFCAIGRLPFQGTRQDYWRLITAISHEQPPQLPQNFSKDFREFVNSCLQTNPNHRRTASQLLKHPFVRALETKDVRRKVKQEWQAWLVAQGGSEQIDANKGLLREASIVIAQELFIKPRASYQPKNLFLKAQFARLGSQLGLPEEAVIDYMERRIQKSKLEAQARKRSGT